MFNIQLASYPGSSIEKWGGLGFLVQGYIQQQLVQLAFLCMLIFVLELDYNILSKDDTQQNKKINSKVS